MLSIAFAGGACAAFAMTARVPESSPGWALPIAAAVCIQLRLLCNMLDGMVAIEGNRRTKTGDLYNEIPDRFADALVLVGAGYAASSLPWAIALGWACAALAIMTAYIRALGQAHGSPPLFLGPMAKPHRMAVMTLAALGAAIAWPWSRAPEVLWAALAIVALGSAVTCARRTLALARHLEQR